MKLTKGHSSDGQSKEHASMMTGSSPSSPLADLFGEDDKVTIIRLSFHWSNPNLSEEWLA